MVKRVAVVGAGPSGLAAVRHFTAPGSPFECQVFEQDDDLGGTWRFSEHVGTDPRGRPVHSSMYKNLKTNLPKEIMSYPDFPFDEDLDKILTAEQVLKYLETYAEIHQLRPHIKFNHCVEEVKPVPIPDEGGTQWHLKIQNLITGKLTKEIFDAVIVANGHNFDPHVPEFKGLQGYKGETLHSHDYRDAERFANKTVLIVGGSFSALDIALQVAQCAINVTISHHLCKLKVKLPQNVKETSDILEFDEHQVRFTNGDHERFDVIIFCTGFNYSFPFLSVDCKITNSGYGVEPLYKHFINIEHPTMCLLELANYVSPLQLADLEVRFFKKYLEGELQLPSKSDMYKALQEDQKMRQEKLNLEKRHAHKFGCLQKSHYDDLAKTAGIQGVDPSVAEYIALAGKDFCVLTSQ